MSRNEAAPRPPLASSSPGARVNSMLDYRPIIRPARAPPLLITGPAFPLSITLPSNLSCHRRRAGRRIARGPVRRFLAKHVFHCSSIGKYVMPSDPRLVPRPSVDPQTLHVAGITICPTRCRDGQALAIPQSNSHGRVPRS